MNQEQSERLVIAIPGHAWQTLKSVCGAMTDGNDRRCGENSVVGEGGCLR